MRHQTEEKNELMGKKIPLTATTHNIVHTFWRELELIAIAKTKLH